MRDTQSRIDQLESECKTLQQANSNLERKCKILRQTNSIILQRQLEGESKIASLEQRLELLREASSSEFMRKAKYQEVVKKNKQYQYTVAVPSIDQIVSKGFPEGEAAGIHEDIVAMVELTKSMKSGEGIESIDPNSTGSNSLYYDGYLPHYKEFADALIEYRHTINYKSDMKFECTIGSMELPREVLDVLQNALHHTHFHSMTFYPNHEVGVGYIDFIANCISAGTRLKFLNLTEVCVDNTRDIDVLCEGINSNNSLQILSLDDCGNERRISGEILNKLKSKTLKNIELHIDLSNLGPMDMSEFLSSNPSLVHLNLGSNPFNRQDAVYISDALRQNTTLRYLEVNGRNIPNHCHLLESVIFDRTSLNAAYESNHHCEMKIWGRRRGVSSDIENFNTCNDTAKNRNKKIYLILSSRNRNRENAACFETDDIDMKHIPRILSVLKPLSKHYQNTYGDCTKEKDEVKPLSIVYEVMRDWKMPELYNLGIHHRQ